MKSLLEVHLKVHPKTIAVLCPFFYFVACVCVLGAHAFYLSNKNKQADKQTESFPVGGSQTIASNLLYLCECACIL